MVFDTDDGAVFGIINVRSNDPGGVRDFYAVVPDWSAIREFTPGAGGTFMKRRVGQNSEATVLPAGEDDRVPANLWIPQIAVDDIREVAARCVAAGGELIEALERV